MSYNCRSADSPSRPICRKLLLRTQLALLSSCILQLSESSDAARTSTIVPLYLTNETLDAYAPRQGSNTAYFGAYEIGTPPRRFTGCFDTGSADVWLPLSSCSSESCLTHDTYEPNASSTYQDGNAQFSIQYATGSVYGQVARDTIQLGDIIIQDQAFGTATQAGEALLQSSCDGIFGLGFPRISQIKLPPPFISMINQSSLAANVFSFWLSPNADEEPAGEMTLGTVNAARMASPATFVEVPIKSYWGVPLGGMLIGSAAIQLSATTAIIDTGSTAITVGAVDGATLHDKIPGATYWADMGVYNISGGCTNIAAQPTISFALGQTTFAVPPALWIIQLYGTCVSGFIPSGRSTQVVLGVTFLRAWHTQYRFDPISQIAQIGFARPLSRLPPSTVASSNVLTFNGRKLSEGNDKNGPENSAPSEHQQPRIFSASIPTAQERGLV